jgi:hypothetical protein
MVKSASRVSRVLMTGPLASFADSYALELEQRRYTPLTSVAQLRQLARLSSWHEVRGLGVAELNGERVEELGSARYRAVALSGHVRACCACWLCCSGGARCRGTRRLAVDGCAARLSVTCSRARPGGGTARGYVRHAPGFGRVLAPRPLPT